MSATVPLTNGMMAAGGIPTQPLGAPAEAPPAGAPHEVQGTGSLTGLHNTPMHVALILLGAGAFITFFHLGGFRIAFDAGMGRG